MTTDVTRAHVLGFRVRAQQLDRRPGELADSARSDSAASDTAASDTADTAVLDVGVQDTGPDGGLWALAIRGMDVSGPAPDELATVWTIRGAPHLYRRAELASVAAAVAPFSDADAGKRIFDAARPLKAAGIGNLAALDEVAAAMRAVVTEPMVKGEVSARLAALLGPPYLRFCRPCDATHLYEQPFRLAALRAGLELRAGTSPPVLQPIPGFAPAAAPEPRHEVIRGCLRLLAPTTPQDVAGYLDAPVKDVSARWPGDAVEVTVDGARAWVLAADLDRLTDPPPAVTRLLGPFDLFLQARDRSVLVGDPARAKALWPVLGRPGAVLHGGEIVGSWRPRKASVKLTVIVEPWAELSAAAVRAVSEQAEWLAVYRRARLAGVVVGGSS